MGVHAVFGFVKDHAALVLEHILGHLIAAISRQAVHEDGVILGQRKQIGVDRVAGKGLGARFLFVLLAHACPCISIYNIGIFHNRFRIICEHEFTAVFCSDALGVGHDLRIRLVSVRRSDTDVEAALEHADRQRMGHVVAVANVAEIETSEMPLLLLDRDQIGDDLRWVVGIGEAVDHRHVGVFGESLHLSLLVGADEDAVDIARQHARRVLHRLAAADLQIAGAQEERLPAQLIHPHLEGHARARRGFLEDHRQGFSLEVWVRNALFELVFEIQPEIHDILNLFAGKITQGEKISAF